MLWAEKGYVACEDQMFLPPVILEPALSLSKGEAKDLLEAKDLKGRAPRHFVDKKTGYLVVKGRGFKVEFDPDQGTVASLKYKRKDVIVPGQGPRLNAFRAIINNDGWAYRGWFENGLHNLVHTASGMTVNEENGLLRIAFDVTSKAPNGAHLEGGTASPSCKIVEDVDSLSVMAFSSHVEWTVDRKGDVTMSSKITSDKPELPLGRLGYVLRVPSSMDRVKYYGRGPEENYSDRYTCAFVGEYEGSVADQVSSYTKPQDMGNHEQTRWVSLSGKGGRKVVFEAVANSLRGSDSGRPVMSFSALPYSAVDLAVASHQHELPAPGDTWLCLDAADTGLGGNSCGPSPLQEDRVFSDATFGFTIRRR